MCDEFWSEHLHTLAGTAASGLHSRVVRPSILALLERLPQTAGIVMSAAFEVLAWNDLAVGLMEDFGDFTPRDRNLARKAFLGTALAGDSPYGIADDAGFRHNVVRELRSVAARYPADPVMTELVEELREGSSDFARLWAQHDVAGSPALRKTFRNTAVVELTVDCDALELTDADQHLILYTAPPGSPDADKLPLLAALGNVGGRNRYTSDVV